MIVRKRHKLEVLILANKGYTNLEISKEVNINEKSIGTWVKKWKKSDEKYLIIIENITKKIKVESEKENIDSFIIKQLCESINILEQKLLLNSKLSQL